MTRSPTRHAYLDEASRSKVPGRRTRPHGRPRRGVGPSAGDPAATPDGQLALQHEWLWSLPSPGYRWTPWHAPPATDSNAASPGATTTSWRRCRSPASSSPTSRRTAATAWSSWPVTRSASRNPDRAAGPPVGGRRPAGDGAARGAGARAHQLRLPRQLHGTRPLARDPALRRRPRAAPPHLGAPAGRATARAAVKRARRPDRPAAPPARLSGGAGASTRSCYNLCATHGDRRARRAVTRRHGLWQPAGVRRPVLYVPGGAHLRGPRWQRLGQEHAVAADRRPRPPAGGAHPRRRRRRHAPVRGRALPRPAQARHALPGRRPARLDDRLRQPRPAAPRARASPGIAPSPPRFTIGSRRSGCATSTGCCRASSRAGW